MFKLEEEKLSTKKIVLLMLIAYAFSFLVRMIWVYQFNGVDSFYWNNQLMINTNDGYYFASSAQQFLEGMHIDNPRVVSWLSQATSFVTVLAVKLTPFSLESAILYMPAIISSLVVIPMILIANLYRVPLLGFFSALIGSIAWSYYNRTMVGYYDTDMFSAMAPMFILYFLLSAIEDEKLESSLYAALAIFSYPFLYNSGLSIIYSIGLLYMAYMIVFHRKDTFTYQSIVLITIALLQFNMFAKTLLIFATYFVMKKEMLKAEHIKYAAYVLILFFLFYSNMFGIIFAKIAGYTAKGAEGEGLKFYGVAQTVREAGKIPFETMANRISGSELGVIVSLIGYIMMVIKYRPFILALPLIGIGVFSLMGGLRFTVYAVPIAAMGALFAFYVIGSFIANKKAKYTLLTLFTLAMLLPNIVHIIGYKVPTVFNKQEVKVLDKLKSEGSEKDYIVTWWDYGYPLWFYTNKNTLIDGGKHNQDNFLASKILSSTSQKEAAYLSRLAVEKYVETNSTVAPLLFSDAEGKAVDVSDYFLGLKNDMVSIPKKTREIYIYLPLRMLNIFPTVNVFSNLDLNSGQSFARPFFYQSSSARDMGNMLSLGGGVMIDKKSGKLKLGNQTVPLKQMIVSQIDNKGKVHNQVQTINPTSRFSVIFMKSYGKFLVLDDKMFNSLFIQLFVLGNVDSRYFESVIEDPLAKVYRVKI